MLDALELADRLTSDRFPDIAWAFADYEAVMLARMPVVIEETLASQDLMISACAPDSWPPYCTARSRLFQPFSHDSVAITWSGASGFDRERSTENMRYRRKGVSEQN